MILPAMILPLHANRRSAKSILLEQEAKEETEG